MKRINIHSKASSLAVSAQSFVWSSVLRAVKSSASVCAAAAVVGVSAMATGCSLEETPYGFYSNKNFPMTEDDAEAAVLYIYDAINYIEYSRAIVFLGDMNTDELEPKGDAAQSTKDIDGWKLNNFKSNTTLGNYFKYSYITINRANSVIRDVAKMSIDESLRNRYVGEAYFMRGYSYFNLARNFGRVPIHTSVVETLEDSQAPLAASLDEMWDRVIEDFETACGLLSYYKHPETGRADLAAAQSMLAKTYLHLASAKANGVPQYADMSFDTEDYYAKAAEYAAKVVLNPEQITYGFSETLDEIYDVEKPDGAEHIFIMSMDRTGASEGQYSKISKMYLPYIAGGTVYLKDESGSLIPTHDGWGEYRTATSFYENSFETGDKRHDELIVSEVYDKDGNVVASLADGKLPYPFCRKYIDPSFVGDKTSTRPYLIRFSDIALVYAEAAGPVADAYTLVNTIRRRAGLGELAPGLSVENFRKAVLNERVCELAFEGNICYDLRRCNLLHTKVSEAVGQGLTAEDVVFYPIPSIETDLNPNIK